MKNASYFIDKLQMLPHPEGGFYKETYRSAELIPNIMEIKEALALPFTFYWRRITNLISTA